MDIKHNTKTVKSKIIIKITNNKAEEIKRTKNMSEMLQIRLMINPLKSGK